MLRKAMMVMSAGVLIATQAAWAGTYHGWEYGAGWGEGVVYGPGYYMTPHNYPYEGYPHIGYDGPPFYLVWDFGADCYVMRRPGHRHLPPRTVQLCE